MIIVTLLMLINSINATISLAVMEFKAGSNMNETNLGGLSEMLINSLYETGHYEIVEMSTVSKALQALNMQGQELSTEQISRLGKYLKVNYFLVGTVNFIATGHSDDPDFLVGEYNIDVRIVDINSSRIIGTAGVVKSSVQTYRSLMPELASQLSDKLSSSMLPCIQGYLYVYPEYLGKTSYEGAEEKAMHLNAAYVGGRNTWRLPSIDELKVIAENLNILNFTISDRGKAYSNKTVFDPFVTRGSCQGIDCYRVYYYELNNNVEDYNGGGREDAWVILVSTK